MVAPPPADRWLEAERNLPMPIYDHASPALLLPLASIRRSLLWHNTHWLQFCATYLSTPGPTRTVPCCHTLILLHSQQPHCIFIDAQVTAPRRVIFLMNIGTIPGRDDRFTKNNKKRWEAYDRQSSKDDDYDRDENLIKIQISIVQWVSSSADDEPGHCHLLHFMAATAVFLRWMGEWIDAALNYAQKYVRKSTAVSIESIYGLIGFRVR